jgi:hypothetical protein
LRREDAHPSTPDPTLSKKRKGADMMYKSVNFGKRLEVIVDIGEKEEGKEGGLYALTPYLESAS